MIVIKNHEIKYDADFNTPRKSSIAAEGKYHGYRFMIIDRMSHPTAYVEVKPNHPFFNKIDQYDQMDIDVHGRLTYADYMNDHFYVGWDYAHTGDYVAPFGSVDQDKKWTVDEIIEDCESVINQLIEEAYLDESSQS